jgi:hypothetical protein
LLTAAAAGAGNARAAGVHCPAGALVLPGSGVEQAEKAALRAAASAYRGLNTKGARVVSAKRATVAGPRGVEVGRECGMKARVRTVVVELRFPRMLPSASLSEGIVDVARFARGYRVWAVVH